MLLKNVALNHLLVVPIMMKSQKEFINVFAVIVNYSVLKKSLILEQGGLVFMTVLKVKMLN